VARPIYVPTAIVASLILFLAIYSNAGYIVDGIIARSISPLQVGYQSSSGVNIVINWVQFSNISMSDDRAFGACGYGDYVYIVGYDSAPGNPQFRIEMRAKSDGRLIKNWTHNPSRGEDLLWSCIVAQGRLYTVGYDSVPGNKEWAILMFDLNLNLLKNVSSNPSGYDDETRSIATDGSYLYVLGIDRSPGNVQWRIEKRNLDDLSLVAVYTSNPSNGDDWVEDIGISPRTNLIWVVGSDGYSGGDTIRIEILDKNLNRLFVSRLFGGIAYSLDFDEEGFAYIAYRDGVAKIEPTGNIVNTTRGDGYYNRMFKIAYFKGYIWVSDIISNKPAVHVISKDLTSAFTINLYYYYSREGFEIPGFAGKMAYDASNLYFTGSIQMRKGIDYRPSWAIFSISLNPTSGAGVTVTSTITVTAEAVPQTVTLTQVITSPQPPATVTSTVTVPIVQTQIRTVPTTITIAQGGVLTSTITATLTSTIVQSVERLSTVTKSIVEAITHTSTLQIPVTATHTVAASTADSDLVAISVAAAMIIVATIISILINRRKR